MIKLKSLLFIFLSFVLSTHVHAKLFVPSIFSDNMMLQRDASASVWGTTEAASRVDIKVSWSWQKFTVNADQEGAWSFQIPTGKAGGKHTMKITSGGKCKEIKNIIFGDVWVLAGQSNMQFGMKDDLMARSTLATLDNPDIRVFFQDITPSDDPEKSDVKNGRWHQGSPGLLYWASAIGCHFAKNINETLDVPVAIVHACQGGTGAQSWLSRESLLAHEETKEIVDAYDNTIASEEFISTKGSKEHYLKYLSRPIALYRGMVRPLQPFAVKGVLWYQGESNCSPEAAVTYRTLFPAVIDCWRKEFKQGDIPFLFVQLPNRDHEGPDKGAWPLLREAQLMTWQNTPNTAMVVTIDVGDASDIHPTNKKPVGDRLALAALANVYGKDIVYSGPIFKRSKQKNSKIYLEFDHVGDGLVAAGDYLRGFTIAGNDKHFVSAKAKILKDKVVVDIPKELQGQEIAIRYAWERNPVDCNLFNKNGLPASPFRTDYSGVDE